MYVLSTLCRYAYACQAETQHTQCHNIHSMYAYLYEVTVLYTHSVSSVYVMKRSQIEVVLCHIYYPYQL